MCLTIINNYVFNVNVLQLLKAVSAQLSVPQWHFKTSNTMVSVSTVQPSINLEFLCTDKKLKMSLYTLFEKLKSIDFQI